GPLCHLHQGAAAHAEGGRPGELCGADEELPHGAQGAQGRAASHESFLAGAAAHHCESEDADGCNQEDGLQCAHSGAGVPQHADEEQQQCEAAAGLRQVLGAHQARPMGGGKVVEEEQKNNIFSDLGGKAGDTGQPAWVKHMATVNDGKAVIVMDAQCIIQAANQVAHTMFGYAKNELR
ncbi:hypothetical protein HaLaN_12557, partial [Haematococcus lacustris]